MKNRINVAELLKDCPKGMELDCTMWDSEAKVFLKEVSNGNYVYPIEVIVKYDNTQYLKSFTEYGAFNDLPYCKCVIFPKGKTTWEGFVPPCKFKDGDIITCTNSNCTFISIFKEKKTAGTYFTGYCTLILDKNELKVGISLSDFRNPRFAAEEEKQKLFQAIKDNGYIWNPEAKTLKKLIEPKFKVGDRIIHCERGGKKLTIDGVYKTQYGIKELDYGIPIGNQDEYELVTDKFDIKTLKQFDKVLVRDCNKEKWNIDFFSYYRDSGDYQCMTFVKNQCIPYENNEHLLGKKDACNEYYKTWE